MKDYKILLVCSGGMSTTILMTKMQKYAEEKGFSLKVDACAMGVCQDKAPEYDVIPVSYTHLDVYKRQTMWRTMW